MAKFDSEMNLIEFQRLCDSRELAALNCVNAIQFVLSMFEAQDFEQSRSMLQSALDRHKKADDAIAEFHRQLKLNSKKETQSDGNRSAA